MSWIEGGVEKVAEVVKEQMKLFDCSMETAWKYYIHEIIKDECTLEQVKEYMEEQKKSNSILFNLGVVGSTLSCDKCGYTTSTGETESHDMVCLVESGMNTTPACDCGNENWSLRLYVKVAENQ